MTARNIKNYVSWLKDPASWISLVAVAISAATFFLVYADKGSLRVVIPHQVGVTTVYGDLSLLVPITITNNGSPRTMRHVTKIALKLTEIEPVDIEPSSLTARWRMELAYVGPYQYYNNYFEILKHLNDLPSPNNNGTAPLKLNYLNDKLDYVNRAIPFTLFGGESEHRLFEFVQLGRGFKKESIQSFKMSVEIETESKTFTSETIYYSCGDIKLPNENYEYCRSYD